MKGGHIKLILVGGVFLLTIVLFSFFIPQKFTIGQDFPIQTVTINEVAWMGTSVSGSDEWIELRNITISDIDLNGWILKSADGSPVVNLKGTIPRGGYYLLERTDDDSVPGINADLIYTGALSDSGENLSLYKEATLVDEINALPSGWPAGKSATKQTMERASNGSWCDSLPAGGTPKEQNSCAPAYTPEAGFQVTATGLKVGQVVEFDASASVSNIPGDPNLIYYWDFGDNNVASINNDPLISHIYTKSGLYEVVLFVENSQGIESDLYASELEIEEQPDLSAGIVINEFISDPGSGSKEWIELYNTTDLSVSLDNWELDDGTGLISKLNGKILSKSHFVYDLSASKLNNAGDKILLKNSEGIEVDHVYYGNWTDAVDTNVTDNAPLSSDLNSVARIPDGKDTENDVADFQLTTTVTKASSNILTNPVPDNPPAETPDESFQYSTQIYINELLPNPEGSDESEWIELFNTGAQNLNLNGWQLDDRVGSGSKAFEFDDSFVIASGAYLVITHEQSGLVLNNSNEEVNLIDPDGKVISKVSYASSNEAESYARKDNGQYAWTVKLTKGAKNIFVTAVIATKARVSSSGQNLSAINQATGIDGSGGKALTYEKVEIESNLAPVKDSGPQDNRPILQIIENWNWVLKSMILIEILTGMILVWRLAKYFASILNF